MLMYPRLNEEDLGAHMQMPNAPMPNAPTKNDQTQNGQRKIDSQNTIITVENSATIRLRVERAIECQKERLAEQDFTYNGNLSHKQIKQFCQIDQKSHELLVRAICQFGLSARSYDRLLRVSRTIADLEASADIAYQHVGRSA